MKSVCVLCALLFLCLSCDENLGPPATPRIVDFENPTLGVDTLLDLSGEYKDQANGFVFRCDSLVLVKNSLQDACVESVSDDQKLAVIGKPTGRYPTATITLEFSPPLSPSAVVSIEYQTCLAHTGVGKMVLYDAAGEDVTILESELLSSTPCGGSYPWDEVAKWKLTATTRSLSYRPISRAEISGNMWNYGDPTPIVVFAVDNFEVR